MHLLSVLHRLADGRFHSGEAMASALGVSRTTVWTMVQRLQALGVRVDRVRGKGYRLQEALVLLDAAAIESAMPPPVRERLHSLDLGFSIDSTNTRLMEALQSGAIRLPAGHFALCLAEMQTAGRGRRGRAWVSPFGHYLYFSLARTFSQGLAGLEGLSLVVGLVVAEMLQAAGVEGLQLKWPNDVLLHGAKLAGILLEMQGDPSGDCTLVIGVGLNVKGDRQALREVSQPWADLARALPAGARDKNQLAAELASGLVTALDSFDKKGFPAFQARWQALDVALGKPVSLIQGDGGAVVQGTALGVTAQGALQVQTAEGLRTFHGGEVSLRAGNDC